jgi:hypothetical protein
MAATPPTLLEQFFQQSKQIKRIWQWIAGLGVSREQYDTSFITPSAANTPTSLAVVFATPFPAGTTPQVQATMQTSVILNGSVGATAITNTGFTLWYCSPNTAGRFIMWRAYI